MSFGILGVIAAHPGTLLCFLHRAVDGLTHLQSHYPRAVFLLSFQNLRSAQHHLSAIREAGPAVAVKGLVGESNFIVKLLLAERLKRLKGLSGRRIYRCYDHKRIIAITVRVAVLALALL